MKYKKITQAIRIQTEKTNQNEHSTPLFLTSSFCFNNAEAMGDAFAETIDAYTYSRFSNPSVDEFTAKMVSLENAEAGFATASGMSAITSTFLCFLKSGDHLIVCNSVFGSTINFVKKYLPKFNIEVSFIHPNATKHDWKLLLKENTKMIFFETPTNPALDIIDIKMVVSVAKPQNIMVVVDNCFATPFIQTPLDLGVDIVIHSATKWIDGQGRVLGGIVLGNKSLINEFYLYCRITGPSLSAFNAWILSKSLETLEIRMERHSSNANFIAESLLNHPKIQKVIYPFLKNHAQYEIAKKQMLNGGGIVSFNLLGGLKAGIIFLNALNMISLTANLGDTRSIASHPASTTHAKLLEEERLAVGITSGLIRISVGLEDRQDILEDILQALEKITL